MKFSTNIRVFLFWPDFSISYKIFLYLEGKNPGAPG